jgi:transposase-like protein
MSPTSTTFWKKNAGTALPSVKRQVEFSQLHYLLTTVPKSAQPWVTTLVRTIFDQPTADAVRAQHAWIIDALEAKYPAACEHLDAAREDLLAFAAFPRETWRQIWSNCEDLLVPSGRGPGPWSNWPCCL